MKTHVIKYTKQYNKRSGLLISSTKNIIKRKGLSICAHTSRRDMFPLKQEKSQGAQYNEIKKI